MAENVQQHLGFYYLSAKKNNVHEQITPQFLSIQYPQHKKPLFRKIMTVWMIQ